MSFANLLRSEWTKFRTVRGWSIGVAVAMLLLIAIGVVSAQGSHTVAVGPHGEARRVLTGPGGEPVQDDFTFAHKTLTGDGAITARVSGLAGVDGPLGSWAKAGVMIKSSSKPGSEYVAVMLTGAHGIRMQYHFTGDVSGGPAPATASRWLRLVRSGSTFTGYASSDGATWTKIGSTRLNGMPTTADAGMFVTSPPYESYQQHVGRSSGNTSPTEASAVFDSVSVTGSASANTWGYDNVGGNPGDVAEAAGSFAITGSGNIAPNVPDLPNGLERTLVGTFAGLIVLIVLAVLSVTSEYRRGMIRTTFAASPRRGRVLAAKSVVVGAIAFVTGLVASIIAIPLCDRMLKNNGNLIFPTSTLTEVRIVIGTAAMLAVAAIFALAIGTLLRRSAGAVTAVIVAIVLPYLLATAQILPAGPAEWLLRLTPAATFAIQQTLPVYRQVDHVYNPALGFFPLSPWGGFGVLCLYAAAALGLAIYVVRRRDV